MAGVSENDIQQQFQQVLGRAASPSEISDMKRFTDTGYVDLSAGDIGRILQSMPEYQTKQLSTYGQQYSQQLGANDKTVLGLAGNQLQEQFAQQGRTISSSAYINAFAGAAQNLALQRQQTLANFYGSGYQNIMSNTQSLGQQTLGLGFNSQAQDKNQIFAQQNFGLQQNAFNQYLNQQNRSNRLGSIGGLLGSGIGAAAGGYFGGGSGAQAGALFGGNLGTNFGRGLGG